MPRWTTESRQQQAERIQALCPWKKSTGPRTEAGKAKSARNAWKGGERSDMRYCSRLLRETGGMLRDVFSSFCRTREYRPRRTFGRKMASAPASVPELFSSFWPKMDLAGELDSPPDPEFENLSDDELTAMAEGLLGCGSFSSFSGVLDSDSMKGPA